MIPRIHRLTPPGFKTLLHPPAPITVRELLGHTSGAPVFFDALFPDPDVRPVLAVPLTSQRLFELAGRSLWDPADIGKFRYSNTNYVALGLLVEAPAGGVTSTVGDVDTFFAALFQGRLLSPNSLTEMKKRLTNDPYALGVWTSADGCTGGMRFEGHFGTEFHPMPRCRGAGCRGRRPQGVLRWSPARSRR